MQQHQPLYSDRHKSGLNLSVWGGIGIAIFDVVFLPIGVFFIVGLGLAAFGWLTTPSQYVIFQDRLLIFYGRPRVRHVIFDQVAQVERLSLAIGDRLLLRLRRGRLLIQPRDITEFENQLEKALGSYLSEHPREEQKPL